jgi:hypothetical protein
MTSPINLRAADVLMNHINKCNTSNAYAAKAILASSIALDFYSNMVERDQIGKNKELKKDEKKFIQTYKLANAFISGASQAAVGLAVISDKAQNFIIKKISNINPNFTKGLDNNAKTTIMQLSSIIAAVLVTKRVLVPLIVTPIATLLKKNSSDITEKNNINRSRQKQKYQGFKYNNINAKKLEENIFARHGQEV